MTAPPTSLTPITSRTLEFAFRDRQYTVVDQALHHPFGGDVVDRETQYRNPCLGLTYHHDPRQRTQRRQQIVEQPRRGRNPPIALTEPVFRGASRSPSASIQGRQVFFDAGDHTAEQAELMNTEFQPGSPAGDRTQAPPS